jgi:hypothetical protein
VANDHTIKTFTAIDIEKYHKGELSAREMHAMEKAALDDPFLADALEGYAMPGVNAGADMAELKKRLDDRTSEQTKVVPIAAASKSSFPWFRAAAMVIILAGSGYFIYKLAFSDAEQGNYAQAPMPAVKEKQEDKSDNYLMPGDSVGVSAGTGAFSRKASPTITIADSTYEGLIGENSNYSIPGAEKEVSDTVSKKRDLVINKDYKIKTKPLKWEFGVKGDVEENTKTTDYYTSYLTTTPSPAQGQLIAPRLDSIFGPPKQQSQQQNWAAAQPLNITERKNLPGRTDSVKRFMDSDADGVADDYDKYKKSVAAVNARRQPQSLEGLMKQENQPRHNLFRGRVTDANNNALPFANITNTADNVGTYSDVKGNFTLISPDTVLNVQVRSVGFENNNIQLQPSARDNQVVMQEDNQSLNQVVVSNRATNTYRTRNNTLVHEEPEPVDGWNNYDLYIANNLNIPDTLKKQPMARRGEVELSFDVNAKGEPINITVNKSLCESCDKEAIRLLKQGPKWKQKSKRKKRTSVTIAF